MNLSTTEKTKVINGEEGSEKTQVENALESLMDQIPAEVLAALPGLPEKAGELFASLVELPAALDTLSRCTLARNFISKNGEGFDFDAQAFENAWTYITTTEQAEIE